jgi:hypothetical protein
MATGGGLEIHMQLAHAPPPAAPPEEPAAAVEEAVPPPYAFPARRASRSPQLPKFLRGFDPTVPLTALMVIALLVGGVAAAVTHDDATGTATITSGQDTATTAPEPEPGPAKPVDAAADERLARSLVLEPNDLPDGWKTTPHQAGPHDAELLRAQAACLGLPDPAATRTAYVAGADASSSDGQFQVQSEVATQRTAQQAHDHSSALLTPKAIPCAKEWITRSLTGQGIHVLNIGAGRFAANTANVPSVALHFEIAGEQNGQRATLYVDEVDLRKGRIEAQVAFLTFGGSFPPDQEQTLTTRFAHKLAYS